MADKFDKRVYLSPDNDPKKENIIKVVSNDSEIIQVVNNYDPNTQPAKVIDNTTPDNLNEIKVVQNTAPNIRTRGFRSRNHRSAGRLPYRNRYRSRITRIKIRHFTLPPTGAGPAMPPTKPPKENDLSPTLIKKKNLP